MNAAEVLTAAAYAAVAVLAVFTARRSATTTFRIVAAGWGALLVVDVALLIAPPRLAAGLHALWPGVLIAPAVALWGGRWRLVMAGYTAVGAAVAALYVHPFAILYGPALWHARAAALGLLAAAYSARPRRRLSRVERAALVPCAGAAVSLVVGAWVRGGDVGEVRRLWESMSGIVTGGVLLAESVIFWQEIRASR